MRRRRGTGTKGRPIARPFESEQGRGQGGDLSDAVESGCLVAESKRYGERTRVLKWQRKRQEKEGSNTSSAQPRQRPEPAGQRNPDAIPSLGPRLDHLPVWAKMDKSGVCRRDLNPPSSSGPDVCQSQSNAEIRRRQNSQLQLSFTPPDRVHLLACASLDSLPSRKSQSPSRLPDLSSSTWSVASSSPVDG